MPRGKRSGIIRASRPPKSNVIISHPRKTPRTASKATAFRPGGWENIMVRYAAYLALGLFVLYGLTMIQTLAAPGKMPVFSNHSPETFKRWSLTFLGIILLVLGFPWLIYAFEKRRQRRVIEEMPTTAARSARPGLVKISGRVKAGSEPLLRSPIGQEECVHFATEVLYLRHRHVSSGGSTWMTEYEESRTVDYLVEDDSGAIRIGDENPDYDWPPTLDVRRGWYRHEELRDFCEAQGLSRKVRPTGWGNQQRRFRETLIRPGDGMLVIGTAKTDPSNRSGSRDLYIGKGNKDSVFCISAHGEREMIGKLQFGFLLAVNGGCVAIVCGIICLVAVFA